MTEELKPSATPIQATLVPVKVWIEKDMMGTVHIKRQNEGGPAFDFIQIQYSHMHTCNAFQHGLAEQIVALLNGAALTAAQPAQNERELPEPSDIGEVGLLRAELAGLNACVGHLSAMVDEQTRLVQKAAQIMKALHESATPDDGPDMDAIIPGVKFSEFVDGHAELLFALAHGPQVTTIEVHGSLTDEQIEPMFRARKATPSQGEKDAWYWYAWGVNDCERRAAQPAQAGERDTGPHVLREVFELCDDTMTKMESESTEFSRGRAFEAKGISRAIGTWFQDEFCGRSHMGEPVTQPAAQATPAQDGTRSPCEGEPMSARKAAYFMQRFKREEKLLGPNEQLAIEFVLALLDAQQATPALDAGELAYNMDQWGKDARTHGSDYVPVHVSTIDKVVKHLRSLSVQQATPEPVGEHAATVAEVHMSRYTLEWNGAPLPEGTKLYTRHAAAPAGMALVPVEPTPEMMEAMPSLPAIGAPGDMELKAKGWSLKAIQNRHRWLAALAAAQAKGGV